MLSRNSNDQKTNPVEKLITIVIITALFVFWYGWCKRKTYPIYLFYNYSYRNIFLVLS